ncbi:MAG: hypothetical protein RIT81_32975 [Deltaproteobacteria bacterium]
MPGTLPAVRRFVSVWVCGVLFACSGGEPCSDAPPGAIATIRIDDAGLASRTRSLEATLEVDGATYRRVFEVAMFEGDTTSFAVTFDPAPTTAGYPLTLTVAAYDTTQASGVLLARGTASVVGSVDACNALEVVLGAAAERDGGPHDGGVRDGGEEVRDGGVRDGGRPPGIFVSPASFDRPWVDRGSELSFEVDVDYPGATSELFASTEPWMTADFVEAGDDHHTLTLTVDTTPLTEGVYSATVAITAGAIDPAEVHVAFRLFRPVYVGPDNATCPHLTPQNMMSNACSFVGELAVAEAAQAAQPFDHLILFDDLDGPAFFVSPPDGIQLPGLTWIGTAEGRSPKDVNLRCQNARGVRLLGDGVRVEGFSIVSAGSCDQVINTWSEDAAEDGTGRHEIDRMILAAIRPEVFGANSIQFAVGLSEDTDLTNSWIFGHWEGIGDLSFAHRSRLINNTYVSYQSHDATIAAAGTQGLTVANNVFVTMSGATTSLIVGSTATSSLTVAGNVHEGTPAAIVRGLDEFDTSNRVVDNTLGADIDSALDPRFFADATPPAASVLVPGIGVSFDGVPIDGRIRVLPGAFQNRSDHDGPRRTVARVGLDTCAACDFTTLDDNEIQRAAWSLWPGGRLEIEPGTYAGNVVVSWPIDIVGVRGSADEIVLEGRDEDVWLRQHGAWASHRAVVAVTTDAAPPLQISNLTVVANANQRVGEVGIFVEGVRAWMDLPDHHVVRQVEIRTDNDANRGLFWGFVVGQGVIVQDALVRGAWSTCGRVAGGNPSSSEYPSVTAAIVNLTCRLQGAPPLHQPASGFEIANVDQARFVNTIVEASSTSTTTALFRAQRRSQNDTGVLARDPPMSFGAFAVHHRGFGTVLGDFTAASGTYALDGVEEVAGVVGDDMLFSGPNDSHLTPIAPARDSGLDPAAVWTELSLGVSLDGVTRALPNVDCGCYEQ